MRRTHPAQIRRALSAGVFLLLAAALLLLTAQLSAPRPADLPETPEIETPEIEAPAPAAPIPVEPTPEEPTPVEPIPEEPVPEAPASEEPVPEAPTPEEPIPEEPIPVEPAPEEPIPEEPTPEAPAPAEPEPLPEMPPCAVLVPASAPVENSYFDDAVFIGDSRTQGLILYTGLANATMYADVGLTVETVFTKPLVRRGGEELPIADALAGTQFGKVYLMLGINETGWPSADTFLSKYACLIDAVRAANPQAVIYVQAILPVTAAVSAEHPYVTNAKICAFNAGLRTLAEQKQVCFLDTASAVADENGCLPEDAAVDGIHLVRGYCLRWLDYLKTHTVS